MRALSLLPISSTVPCIGGGEPFFCFGLGILFFNIFSFSFLFPFILWSSLASSFSLLGEAFPSWKSFGHPRHMAQIKLSSKQVSRSLDSGITTNNLRRFQDLVLCLHIIKEACLCWDQLTEKHGFWWALVIGERQRWPFNLLASFCFLASVS